MRAVRRRFRAGALVAAAVLLAGTAVSCTDDGGGTTGPSPDATRSSAPPSSPAASPSGGALPASVTGQLPVWRPCKAPAGDPGADAPGGRWQCASIRAPLDYATPDGETMSLALIRAEATDEKRRIGSLVFNFGGPGASGVGALPGFAEDFTQLNERYDLVSFDPRGVAGSSSVVCRDDRETEASHRVDNTPDSPAEERAFLADSAAFGAGCAQRSGKVLPHVSTANTARDMDLIRHVLGDAELHYFGFSYGTELGGVYAHLFPKNVGRLVMDAVVDPTADFAGGARNQALGFQRALDNYFTSRGTSAKDGTAEVAALLKRLDGKPLPASPGRELTESLALTAVVFSLYSEERWPLLTEGLAAAERGDGTKLLDLADSYNSRDAEGRYSTKSHSQRAISCADARARPTADDVKSRHLADFTRVSPVFGPYLAWDVAGWCAQWPVKGTWEKPQVSAKGAPPVLVIGTTGDPSTPYEGAQRMAEGLGAGVGVLISSKGQNHGSYGFSPCVTRLVDAYLLSGKVPKNGTTCG
ncbi:alpha/beta hydrolase [Streptomyces sp. NPDC048057]|uniref:alpha/beta hydrolase n=1 Tax=Streptomyces sp. NPDC048057 TaxID=3155628 RepID=UPI0033D4203D